MPLHESAQEFYGFAWGNALEAYTKATVFVSTIDLPQRLMGIMLFLAAATIIVMGQALRRRGRDMNEEDLDAKEKRKRYVNTTVSELVTDAIEAAVMGEKITREEAQLAYKRLAQSSGIWDLMPRKANGKSLLPVHRLKWRLRNARLRKPNGQAGKPTIPGDKPLQAVGKPATNRLILD